MQLELQLLQEIFVIWTTN